jgi:hypothetical protein
MVKSVLKLKMHFNTLAQSVENFVRGIQLSPLLTHLASLQAPAKGMHL